MKLKAVPLAVFIVISMTACGDSKPKEDPNRQVQVKNDYYSSKEDCIKDWGKEDYCKPESDRPYSSYMSSSSSWSGIGIGSSSGSTGISSGAVASSAGSTTAPAPAASTSSTGGGGGFYAYGFHGPTYYQNGSSGSRAFTDTTGNVVKAKSNNASRFVTSYAKAGDVNRINVPASIASKLPGGESSKSRVQSVKNTVQAAARSSGSRGFFSGGRASSGG